MTERLIQVTAPHFCAGIVIKDGQCVVAAPILKWAIGKDSDYLSRYFRRKGWRAVEKVTAQASFAPP